MFASSRESERLTWPRLHRALPEIAVELLRLPDVVLDGELDVLDEKGAPQFDRLVRLDPFQ